MSGLRQFLRSALPSPLRKRLKSGRQWFRDRVADRIYFPLWLAFQCLRHRQRAVILCRLAALGDVLCTLPLAQEIRQRHPQRLLILVTAADYQKMARLARVPDQVYGARSWTFSVTHHFLGLIEKIYVPQTTDERSPNAGAQCHLVDDLANSCGLTIPPTNRQPRLFPSLELIKAVQAKYGLTEAIAAGQRIIGINCGRTWPVRMWEAGKWQTLVDQIHAEQNVVILQFGLTHGAGDEYEQLRGVRLLTNRLKSDELVALVAGCDLLVSIDSGPVHIAGAVGTPVVGLFGAVNPQHRLPTNSPGVGLFADVPCRFCHHENPRGHWKENCAHDIRCMKELDVPTVFDAVKSMLAKSEKIKA